MASTFTTGFGIEKIGSGEQSGAWGTTTNHNLDILDRIASYKAVALSGTTHTLTVREASPGSGTENLQDGMYRVIKFTGALGANNTVTIAPNTAPAYFIFENATTDSASSGPYSVILTQGSGANITIQNGKNAIVYCDGAGSGAAVVNALSDLQIATLEVTGVSALDGAVTVGGNIDVDGTTNLDAVDIDGAVQIDATLSVGVDDTGYDVKFFGDTASAYMLWDTSADDLILGGAARLGVGTAPAADMVLDVNGQIKAGSTGASLDTTPGGFGTFIQTTSSGQCAIMSYSSGGGTTLSLHSNTGGAAVVENIRMSPTVVTVNEGSLDMDFRVESNGNANMLFVDGGNNRIGIGTATPTASFDFRAGLNGHSQFTIDPSTTAGGGAGGAFLKFLGSNAASAPQIAGIDGSMTNGTDGSESGILAFFTTNSGTSAEKMRILADGKVGIGTASPSYHLHIKSADTSAIARITNTGAADANVNSILQLETDTNIAQLLLNEVNNYSQFSHSGDLTTHYSDVNTHIFRTKGGTERMRIDASGNLLVGTTTVRNTGLISVDYTSASQGGMGINDTNSGNGGSHIAFLTGGTFRGGITNNNNTAVAYNTTSDARLKENLVPISDAIGRVNNLNPVKFNWIDNGSVSEGFIAQEILAGDEQLAADMVTGDPDGDAAAAPMQVDYAKITPLLTAALQQALAKIEALEARITALEG